VDKKLIEINQLISINFWRLIDYNNFNPEQPNKNNQVGSKYAR